MTPLLTNLAAVAGATLSLLACVACDRAGDPPAPAASALASAAVAPAAAVTRATLTVDAAHDVMTKKDASTYAIAPATDVTLEVGDYAFVHPDAAGPGAPDAVHVVHGSVGYYRATLSGKRLVLNAASLDTVKGHGAFPGFEAGETYIVAVGAEASGADGAMRFTPLWTTKVTVAPK